MGSPVSPDLCREDPYDHYYAHLEHGIGIAYRVFLSDASSIAPVYVEQSSNLGIGVVSDEDTDATVHGQVLLRVCSASEFAEIAIESKVLGGGGISMKPRVFRFRASSILPKLTKRKGKITSAMYSTHKSHFNDRSQ